MNDPYNLYFTPDGKYAIVVAERLTGGWISATRTPWRWSESVPVPCRGVNHMDFSADGRYFIAACEFSGESSRWTLPRERWSARSSCPAGAMPQDVSCRPTARIFYIADMMAERRARSRRRRRSSSVGFLATGKGAHGLYFSRDSKWLYVSNRGEGSVSRDRLRHRHASRRSGHIPGGGSPDMGGVSADGKVLWLSGRYNAEVYAFDTADGHLLARIPVEEGAARALRLPAAQAATRSVTRGTCDETPGHDELLTSETAPIHADSGRAPASAVRNSTVGSAVEQ